MSLTADTTMVVIYSGNLTVSEFGHFHLKTSIKFNYKYKKCQLKPSFYYYHLVTHPDGFESSTCKSTVRGKYNV